jgi:transcriptional regulator with XRE-family HTH domain
MTSESVAQRLNEEIRIGMVRCRLKQADLAQALGRSQVAVSRRLAGKVPWSADELETVSRLLGITLVFGSETAVA